jgi:hypothetical protein
MDLGPLALHVATLPRQLIEFVAGDELDFGTAFTGNPTAGSQQELLERSPPAPSVLGPTSRI